MMLVGVSISMSVEVKNLTKKFKGVTAVDDVSFQLKEGEILGLLGPNGAGKTTTVQMMLGTLKPTAGGVFYFGQDFSKHREEILEQVGFSSAYLNLPWGLTVSECLRFLSYFYRIKNRRERLKEIVELFSLQELLPMKNSELSAGQISRVNLAKAFLNFPKVLLLDEPTASLDPETAHYIREFLLDRQKKFNVSMIFTSHNMAEVEELCDRVLFIDKGKIIADDTPSNLAKTIEMSHLEFLLSKDQQKFLDYCEGRSYKYTQEGKFVCVDLRESQIAQFLQGLAEQNILYDEISIKKPTLEDYFLSHVARSRVAGQNFGNKNK